MGSQEKTGFRTDEPVAFARKESNSRDTNVNTPERMPVPLPAPLRAILYKNRELLQLSQQCLQRPCTIITNNYSLWPAMFEPVRGGTRGGQAEFKWSDVSADKDREVRIFIPFNHQI